MKCIMNKALLIATIIAWLISTKNLMAQTPQVGGSNTGCQHEESTFSFVANGCYPNSYSWSHGVANTQTIKIKWTEPGNHLVSCTCTTFYGSASASLMVVVSPTDIVTATASASSVEVGTQVTLNASGADAYTWSGPGLHSTSGAQVTATPVFGNNSYTASQVNVPSGNCTGRGKVTVTGTLAAVNAGAARQYCSDHGDVDVTDQLNNNNDPLYSQGTWSLDGVPLTSAIVNTVGLARGYHTVSFNRQADNKTGSYILEIVQTSIESLQLSANSSCENQLNGSIAAVTNGHIIRWERSYKNEGGWAEWEQIASTANPYPYSETKPCRFRAVAQIANCDVVTASDEDIVEIHPIVTNRGTMNTAGLSTSCEAVQGTLHLSGNDGVVEYWQRSDNKGLSWSIIDYTQGSTSILVSVSSPVKFQAVIRNGSCPLVYSDIIDAIPGKAVGGNLSFTVSEVACQQVDVTLVLQGHDGDKLTWQQSPDGETWQTHPTATGLSNEFSLTERTYLRVMVERTGWPSCAPSYSTVYSVNVSSQGGIASMENPIGCESVNGDVNLTGHVGAIQNWQYSIDGSTWLNVADSDGRMPLPITVERPEVIRYYRAAVKLGSCPVAYSTPAVVTLDPRTVPGVVRLMGEVRPAETLNGALTFYPMFELRQYTGTVQNWWKYQGTGQAQVASNNFRLEPTITETTGFRAQVKNGACLSLLSGQATFVVNKFFEGVSVITEALGQPIHTYDGHSYQIKNGGEIELGTNFVFRANSAQEFFVLLDDSYAIPPAGTNYVLEELITERGLETESDVLFANAAQKESTINYLDDLGRSLQTVDRRGSPDQTDVVVPYAYDNMGRRPTEYLPYASSQTNGEFQDDAITKQAAFYLAPPQKVVQTSHPFSATTFERSILGRVLVQGAPGSDWQPASGHGIKYQYLVGLGGEAKRWRIDEISQRPVFTDYFGAGELQVKVTIDEHNYAVREYIDKEGKLLLKRVQNGSEWLETYNIYDDFGSLRYVIQPAGSALVTASPDQSFLDRWSYQYRYDERRRLVEKKAPGVDWVFMIYDKYDRLVLNQDGNQRQNNQWFFTKYDAFNRPLIKGIYTASDPDDPARIIPRSELKNALNAGVVNESYTATGAFGYTNNAFPTTSVEVQSVTYYDDYRFAGDVYNNALSYDNTTLSGIDAMPQQEVKGQISGIQNRVLGTNVWLRGITWYNAKYQEIQTLTENNLGGTDRISSLIDFSGKVTKTLHQHKKGANITTILEEFNYDHRGRLLSHYHTINEGARILLTDQRFNALGQLVEKNLHAKGDGTFVQSIDYRYNIRGWLTHINNQDASNDGGITNDDGNDWFGMELRYQNPVNAIGVAQYNGNISEMIWSSPGLPKQAYGFSYDNANRLKSAVYKDFDNSANNGRYNENVSLYDHNGNIKALERWGKQSEGVYGKIDDLRYDYLGNRLLSVTHQGTNVPAGFDDKNTINDDYLYDSNGNMVSDKNKNTIIEYNGLNLPTVVSKPTGEIITYGYSATGVKLFQEVDEQGLTRTDYAVPFHYKEGNLKLIQHAEGRILPKNQGWEYQYFIKDHLGNVRVTFTSETETESSMATLESSKQATESGEFLNYDRVSKVNMKLLNHTPGESTHYSMRLTANSSHQNSLVRTLAVLPGDTIRLQAFGKYIDNEKSNWSVALSNLVLGTAGATITGGVPVDGPGSVITGESVLPIGNFLAKGETNQGELKAYLNYLIFDKDFKFRTGGYVNLSKAPKEDGSNVHHEELTTELVIDEPGFLYTYLSNEQPGSEVFFDDFSVTQIYSPILQVVDYYPFGLTFNTYQKENAVDQEYLYNGKELVDELNLGWYDYGARMYMSDIGRWGVMDPLSEKYRQISAYAYAVNNPGVFIDPDGKDVLSFTGVQAQMVFLQLRIGMNSSSLSATNTDPDKDKKGKVTVASDATRASFVDNAKVKIAYIQLETKRADYWGQFLKAGDMSTDIGEVAYQVLPTNLQYNSRVFTLNRKMGKLGNVFNTLQMYHEAKEKGLGAGVGSAVQFALEVRGYGAPMMAMDLMMFLGKEGAPEEAIKLYRASSANYRTADYYERKGWHSVSDYYYRMAERQEMEAQSLANSLIED